jgi:16S rRNA (uracil1498-N3)-methyltransferase
MTRRRWIADIWNESTATLAGAKASHLGRVLRAQPGMEFDLVVGARVRRAIISTISEDSIDFTLGEDIEVDPPLPVTLLLAIFKFDRVEWAIEKTTELGVARIMPVIARRTEKHLAQAAATRVERWRRIAREAAQQSRRSDTPVITDPILLKDAVTQESSAVRLLLAENERRVTLKDTVEGYDEAQLFCLAVGPEGGWTTEEESLFATQGWKPVSLGPRILRAETAAIAALSIVTAFGGSRLTTD